MQHYKVHRLLSEEELHRLELFAALCGRTTDECHDFIERIIHKRGESICRTAVGNWLKHFRRSSHGPAGDGLVKLLSVKFDDALDAVQMRIKSMAGAAMIRANAMCCGNGSTLLVGNDASKLGGVGGGAFVHGPSDGLVEFVPSALFAAMLKEAFFA